METKDIPISDLVLLDKNPRKIKDAAFDKLVESIKADPEFLQARPVIASNRTGELIVIAGNQRVRAAKKLDMLTIPTIVATLTEEQEQRWSLKDNVHSGEWDWEILAELEKSVLADAGFTENEIKRGMFEAGNDVSRKLIEDYIIPPFSVFDAKQGYWQDRKKEWIRQIGDSGEGRPDDLMGGLKDLAARSGMKQISGTSVFDPVLAEVLYTWYVTKGGLIIDPFAGGNVRGAIAGLMGNKYIGTDLSEKQVAANQEADVFVQSKAEWHCDDGLNLNKYVQPGTADFLLTCPPYYDLEQYTDNPADISNAGTYEEFRKVYAEILARTYPLLKQGAFATVVVGNVRGEDGGYHDLVGDTVRAMEAAGYQFYNEIILATAIANAALRARRIFEGGKKVVKVHQNVLTFWKKDTEVRISGTIKELIEAGVTAKAHENVLMFKKQ